MKTLAFLILAATAPAPEIEWEPEDNEPDLCSADVQLPRIAARDRAARELSKSHQN